MNKPQRILIVRTDRLGDVMLTTPISSALKAAYPGCHITWLVRPYAAPLLAGNPDIDEVITDSGSSMADLVARLKEGKFDTAIVAYPRFRTVWAVWRAGIVRRIGPASKFYTALLTDRVWQHRSTGEKHEADYNLLLLETLGLPFKRYPSRFELTADERDRARKFLESNRITFKKPLIVIHPGSGGSSARWPLSSFMELGDRLQEAGYDVVVTGGPGEDYQYIMIDNMRRIPVFVAAGSVSVRELAAIFSCASLLVTNSTGPLHIATALDVPTVSIFSPIPTCHPQRWGPYPDYAERGNKHGVALGTETVEGTQWIMSVSVETVMEMCLTRLGGEKPVATPRV